MKRKILMQFCAVLLIGSLCLFGSCKSKASSDASTTAAGTSTTVIGSVAEDAEAGAVEIGGDFSIVTQNGTVTANGKIYTLSSAGEYTLSGALSDGQVIVDAGEDDEITLNLDTVSITCSFDSPIYLKTADKVKIKALEGSYNLIEDTRPLQTNENDTTGSAAIYAQCDLNLIGSGRLVVKASYNNGIHTKDDLKIKNQILKVTAPNNAIKGNDSLTIESGNIIAISTSGDALKTSNSDISSKGNQRGTVAISGGTIELYAGNDGIDAAYDVEISGADTGIAVYTYRNSSYTSSSVSAANDSTKGIKSDNEIRISGGTIVIKSYDDGIHANNDNALENGATPTGNVTVSGGSIAVTTSDDGIHADGTLLIEDGYIDVIESYEGLEGHYVTVNGGEMHVYATDDGVNATSTNQWTSDGVITVTGGKMFVEVAGRDVDGVDSNGIYVQSGGFVVVSNPNANSMGTAGAMDTDDGVTITGGILVALGTVPSSGGMGGGPGGGRMGMGGMSASNIPSGAVTFSSTLSAGTHTFTYGSTSESFTLKSRVTAGWIWASGITSSNYSLN